MKNTLNLIVLILLSGVILFTGCKKKDDDVPQNTEEQQREKLSKTWVPANPVLFGNPPAADTRFTNFEITFSSNGTYTSVNGGPVFRPTGTWLFKAGDTNFNTLVLDGRPEFNITSLTDTSLKGNVNLEGGANARTTGVDGLYVFDLIVK